MKKTLKRPKAFWGALVGTAINAIGSMASSYANARSQEKQQRLALQEKQQALETELDMQNKQQAATTLNNYLNRVPEEEEIIAGINYARGGTVRRRLRNPFEITDGGVAIPVDKSTFLLRGSSHQDTNESGQTGIGINFGGKEVEAEGGEVVQRKGNTLRIYSDQPMLGGISPADAVLNGASKDKIFAIQEALKLPRRGMNMRCGGRLKRPKARWGMKADGTYGYIPDNTPVWGYEQTIPGGEDNKGYGSFWGYTYTPTQDQTKYTGNLEKDFGVTSSDPVTKEPPQPRGLRPELVYGLNTGLDFLGSLGSTLINNRYLRDVDRLLDPSNFTRPNYVDEIYIPASTKVYTGARQSELARARERGMRTIARNTASSNVANSRMQEVNTGYTENINKLWEDASNKSLEMRRANIERAQAVAARNAAARNRYYQTIADFDNKLTLARLDNKYKMGTNWASLIASAASSIGNGLQNYLDYQTNGTNLGLATLPYLTTNKDRQRVWDNAARTYRPLGNIKFS